MRRSLAVVLVVGLLSSTPGLAVADLPDGSLAAATDVSGSSEGAEPTGGSLPPGGTFFDDDGHPEEGYIEALAHLGVLRPCGGSVDDLVCPDRPVDDREFQALVARARCITSGLCSSRWIHGSGRNLLDDPDLAPIFATDPCSEEPIDGCNVQEITIGSAAGVIGRSLGLTPVVPPPRPSIELVMTGDMLIHTRVSDRAAVRGGTADYDYYPMLARVADHLASADLALCHLEVPLSPDNTRLAGYPRFRAPREVAVAIAEVGYDGCSVASNHSVDKGFGGLTDTLDILDEYGLGHTGTARTHQEALMPSLYRVGPATIGHLSYTYGTNGIPLPSGMPWSVNKIDIDEIISEAMRAKALGADFVVVSLHWGAEYRISPTGAQQRQARALLESDAIDLLVGHHAHVVQPLGRVGDKYVAYGLGNFLSGQCCTPANTRDGVIAHWDLAQRSDGTWAVRSVEFTPTWVNRYGRYHVFPTPESIEDGDLSESFRRTLARSQRRTIDSLGMLGEQITIREPYR